MDENLARILHESNSITGRLQILAAFFEDDDIYKIYLRSQVIHKLFENNRELDINKLELFHLQFTATTIELLKKIKRGNEQNVSLMFDEIQLNRDFIDKLNGSVNTEKQFNLDKKNQSLKMNLSLRRLYQELSDNNSEDPFSRNIQSFSARYASEFYYEIAADLFELVIKYESNDCYVHSFALIQKKLMGNLCKYDFKTEFYAGFKCGSLILEIYRLPDADKYFLFLQTRNLLLFCDPKHLMPEDYINNVNKKSKLVQELQEKNTALEVKIKRLKTFLPPDIKILLIETYNKISNISFLQNLSNVDTQANILKAMLNTDSL